MSPNPGSTERLCGNESEALLGIRDSHSKSNERPDGLRAWVVALANFFINFIVVGLGRMSGILYIVFMSMFNIDRQTASMPFSIQQAARNFFGPLAGILGQKYGIRFVTVTGGFIGTLSAVACYFTMDITWITILWGLTFGICTALTTTLNQVPIDMYFEKYRTTAGGLAFCGGCVAAFIFPVMLDSLILLYGMGRTFLVMGALIFLVIPAALILVKPPWMEKGEKRSNTKEAPMRKNKKYADYNTLSPSKQESVTKTAESIDFKYLKEESELVFHIFVLTMEDSEFLPGYVSETLGTLTDTLPLVKELEELYNFLQSTRKSKDSLSKNAPCHSVQTIEADINGYLRQHSTDAITKSPKDTLPSLITSSKSFKTYDENPKWSYLGSKLLKLCETNEKALLLYFPTSLHNEVIKVLQMLKILNDLILRKETSSTNNNPTSSKSAGKFLDELTEFRRRLQEEKMAKKSNSFVKHIKTAIRLHANPLFLLICLCRGVFMLTFIPLVTIIVDFAMDKGLTQNTGRYLIAVLSLGDLLGRLCLGWINDSGLLSLPRYMLVGMILLACSTATLPLMDSEVSLMPAVLIFGMLQGSLFIRHQILVSKYMEEDEQAIGMGFINFLSGFIGFALPFYIGYFRDVQGSYDELFYLNGAVTALVGVIWVFEPILVRFASKESKYKEIL